MKKIILLVMVVMFMLLVGCGGSRVSVFNIDNHLNQEDTVYIDLRSQWERTRNGYIDGFIFIEFNETLINEGILRRSHADDFHERDVLDEEALRALFDENKTLYIMCRTGNRSQYVVDALKHLGYTDVYNIGGMIDYEGEHLAWP